MHLFRRRHSIKYRRISWAIQRKVLNSARYAKINSSYQCSLPPEYKKRNGMKLMWRSGTSRMIESRNRTFLFNIRFEHSLRCTITVDQREGNKSCANRQYTVCADSADNIVFIEDLYWRPDRPVDCTIFQARIIAGELRITWNQDRQRKDSQEFADFRREIRMTLQARFR